VVSESLERRFEVVSYIEVA